MEKATIDRLPTNDFNIILNDIERESDILNFSDMSAIDVVVVVAHTQFRTAAVTMVKVGAMGSGTMLSTAVVVFADNLVTKR